jgi:hypothetical protein
VKSKLTLIWVSVDQNEIIAKDGWERRKSNETKGGKEEKRREEKRREEKTVWLVEVV